jgi:hypothetical protein
MNCLISFFSIEPVLRRLLAMLAQRGTAREAVAALAAVAVVACGVAALAQSGSVTALLEYPMNADAIGVSGLTSAKAQMAFGGMEALQRQVDEMGIHVGGGPQHVKQNFANAYGKLSALKKLVNHMETKDFDSANNRLAVTPDQALQAVMAHREDEDVEAAQEAALHQRGRAGLHRLHSLHMAGGRDPSAAGRLVVAPPYSGEEAGQGRYDPALRLSAAKRRRLAQRAAVRVADGASENDEPVSPPWTR